MMRVYLRTIKLYNFKSFCGEVIVGPFMPFTAIIGRNGVGKSNIMDAISFVVGEKRNSALRVRQLNDLISRRFNGIPIANSAHVTAVFEIDGKSKEFTRFIHNSSNKYEIDNQVVSFELYVSELALLGLNMKCKSFLVYQDTIESWCISSPKGISAMFDVLSKSAELKPKYERLKNEMHKMELDLDYITKKRKHILAQRRLIILQLEEAKEYNLLQKEYTNKKTELQLFKLFHIRQEMKNLKVLWNENRSQICQYESNKKDAEILLQQKCNKYVDLTDFQTQIENQLTIMEQELSNKNEELVNAKEKISHLQQKISLCRSSLMKSHLANENHKKTIQDLQDQLVKIEELKISLRQSISSQLTSQGSNIELDNEQVQEYCVLKGKIQRECAKDIKYLNCLKHEQENDQYKLDNEKRKKQEMEDKKRGLQFQINEMEKQIEKLEQFIITTETTLTEQQNLKDILEIEIIHDKTTMEGVLKELNRITKELSDIKADKFAILREHKNLNTINILKALFPEVYGRLSTMCQPIHESYNIAMTKVFWKYKDAIVVKTEEVAKQCINYLKEQQIGMETFLPLDSLKVQPLNKNLHSKLRDMKNLKHVQLLYDVIDFFPKEISNAILFVTKNILVCETPEDAQRIAYETDWNNRYACISLDGCYYQKSGIISGGSFELSAKAAIWQNKHTQQLKLQKITLIEKFKEASKFTRKQSKLNIINCEISSLTNKLMYSRIDIQNIKQHMVNLKINSENIDQQLILLSHNIESVQKDIETRYNKIVDTENQIYRLEDNIFNAFCKSIGIINIREYENNRLRIREKEKAQEAELDNQYNCIKNTLDLETHRNTKDKVKQYEDAIQSTEEQLKLALSEKSLIACDIEKQKEKLNFLQYTHANNKKELFQVQNEITECRHQLNIITKSILEINKNYTAIKMKMKQNVAEINSILQISRMKGLTIPMLNHNTPQSSADSLNSMSSDMVEPNDDSILSIINFSCLSRELYTSDNEQFEDIKKHLIEDVIALENKLKCIAAPNLKAEENLASIHEKLITINKTLKEIRNTVQIAKNKFTRIQKERIDRFMKCFDFFTSHIDFIYKNLCNDMSAQSSFTLHNPEEPYLDSINYSCIVPRKRFQLLSSLSGGEQVIAILAFLFTILRYDAAPFIILDEIDANLDNINIANVVRFMQSNIDLTYFIVISLKTNLLINAKQFVGIASRPEAEFLESSVFVTSFKEYESNENN